MSPATEYLLNTSLTLLGIVVLAWLLVYVSRRWERSAPPGPLQLLATLRLEGKRAVYLVRIGERLVALGISEGGMIKIGDVAPEEVGGQSTPAPRFRQILERLRGQSAEPPAPPETPDSVTEARPAEEPSPGRWRSG